MSPPPDDSRRADSAESAENSNTGAVMIAPLARRVLAQTRTAPAPAGGGRHSESDSETLPVRLRLRVFRVKLLIVSLEPEVPLAVALLEHASALASVCLPASVNYSTTVLL